MTDWICIDEEPNPDGIVGGDGASDSVSIRFHHATEPAIVTVYLYAIDLEERGYTEEDTDGEFFDVEEQVEFMVVDSREHMDDPGSHEVWSDAVYDRPSQRWWPTVLDAEDYRDFEANRWLSMGADYFLTWDGKSV